MSEMGCTHWLSVTYTCLSSEWCLLQPRLVWNWIHSGGKPGVPHPLPSLPKCWVYVMLGMEPRAACVVGQDCTSWAARAAEFTRALTQVDTVFKPVSGRELTLFGTVVSVLCLNVHHSSFILTEPNSKVHLFCFSVQFQENFSKWNMYLAFIL